MFQEVAGEIVLLPADASEYFALDDIGTRFWALLVEHGDFGTVFAAMLAEYDVDEARLRGDLEALVARLRAAGLLAAG